MANRKFKSYLITNIPESDWKRFKRWTAIEGFDTLNQALSSLIKSAGNNKLNLTTEMENAHTT